MDNKSYKVYILLNKCNDKKYVGMTSSPGSIRLKGHKKEMHLNRPLYNDMRLLGYDNYYMVDVTEQSLSKEEATILEREVVDILLENGESVYNIYLSGQISQEVKNLRSRLLVGNKNRLGIPHTEDIKLKISNSTKGRKKSEITRERISKSQLGELNHKSISVVLTVNSDTRYFSTIKQCYEYLKSEYYPEIGYTTVKRIASGVSVDKYKSVKIIKQDKKNNGRNQ